MHSISKSQLFTGVLLVLVILSHPNLGVGQTYHDGDDTLRAVVHDGLDGSSVGHLYTADFRALTGAKTSAVSGPGAIEEEMVDRSGHEFTIVQSLDELRANAKAWDLRAADLDASRANRHAYVRAYEITRVIRVKSGLVLPTLPANAEWYISAIYMGRLHEVLMSSATVALPGVVEPDDLMRPDLEALARVRYLQLRFRALGLQRRLGTAIWPNDDPLRDHYAPRGEVQPIFVEYTRIRSPVPTSPSVRTRPPPRPKGHRAQMRPTVLP